MKVKLEAFNGMLSSDKVINIPSRQEEIRVPLLNNEVQWKPTEAKMEPTMTVECIFRFNGEVEEIDETLVRVYSLYRIGGVDHLG